MDQSQTELIELVTRHLELERQMTAALDELNAAMEKVLSECGIRGPKTEDVLALEPVSEGLQKSTIKLAEARTALLERLNRDREQPFESLKEFIYSVPKQLRTPLDAERQAVLERSKSAQANLVQNQATLYYMFDFHRKYLAGVLQGDFESQTYRSDGQVDEVGPGNLIKKAC